jgi:hypothetical protein
VSFESDTQLSQINEYEVLQLLMGDCRDKLQAYRLSTEEEVKYSQVGMRHAASLATSLIMQPCVSFL